MKKTENEGRQLVAGNDKGLYVTTLVASACVGAFALLIWLTVQGGTWLHEFFFNRGFVQWVLLVGFAVGAVHLILRRWPAMRRERRAVDSVLSGLKPQDENTFAARRRRQVRGRTDEEGAGKAGAHAARNSAEHDEAELDGAYRVSGDIVQMLPLIGFFGTVYGLSKGLYTSFLAEGTVSIGSFAEAIAIAFDNTLLGLALTILLFGMQSVLRKREDAALLELNLWASDETQDDAANTVPGQESALIENLARLNVSLETAGLNLVAYGSALQESICSQINETGVAVLSSIAETQRLMFQEVGESVAEHLKSEVTRLVDDVAEKSSGLSGIHEPLREELVVVQTQLAELAEGARKVVDGFERMTNDGASSALAAQAERLTTEVVAIQEKMDWLPEHSRQLDVVAESIGTLAGAIGAREEAMLKGIQASITSHGEDLKTETARLMSQPREFTLVEAPQHSNGNDSSRRNGNGAIHRNGNGTNNCEENGYEIIEA